MSARLVDIGREWQSRLKRFFDTPLEADAKPLEICEAVLDDVERRVQPVGRGRRVFPYTRVTVRVRQGGADRPSLEAAFAPLPVRIRERLAELQCEASTGLDVKLTFLKKDPQDWSPGQLFAIDYQNEPVAPAVVPAVARTPHLRVTVLKGAATEAAYTFTEPVISIGRTPDPTDERGRMRRNRVAFLDEVDGVTETVGRAHARVRFDPATGEYHLFDDGSSNGTSVLRDGAVIPVARRDPRGVRVRSGDEVQIGRALIRVEIGE